MAGKKQKDFDNLKDSVDQIWDRVKYLVDLWQISIKEFKSFIFAYFLRFWESLM